MSANGTDRRDAIILGGGPVGMAQALALAAHGLSCHVIERRNPAAMLDQGFDGRTFAISSSTMRMFRALGLGDALAGKTNPIDRIWVSDGMQPGALDFEPGEEEGPLGHMVESRILRRALHDAVSAQPSIQVHAPVAVTSQEIGAHEVTVSLDNGERLTAALLISAEGRNSESREKAGLRSARWNYDHVALVGAATHEKPHGNTAFEIFYPEGPFALLPMRDEADGRHRSAFVWSVPKGKAAGYEKLPDMLLAREMERASAAMLGAFEICAPRSMFPLTFQHSAKITADRMALIGDSAHVLHPIAGQGINLGFRDVAALTEVLVDGARLGLEPGNAQLLARYERWRAADALSVASATDGLTRLFAVPSKTASAVRRLGLSAVRRTPPLRRFFMNEARGTLGKLPSLLRGSLV